MTQAEFNEAEENVAAAAGHRRTGESVQEGVNRVKEEIHQAATNISTGKVSSYIIYGNIIDCLYFDHKNMKHVCSKETQH